MNQDEVEHGIDLAVSALMREGAALDQIIGALHLKAAELTRGTNRSPTRQ